MLASNNAQAQAKTVFAHDIVEFQQHSRISASGIEAEKPIKFPRLATLYYGFFTVSLRVRKHDVS